MSSPTLVWFRHDLRLHDNPSLQAALSREEPIVPVFIWAPDEEGDWAPASASRWWLHQSLMALDNRLRKLGSRLTLRAGPSLDSLQELIDETKAGAVYWNRRYEPCVIERDTKIKKQLAEEGIEVESFNSHLLYEPWTIKTQQGGPYQVFTPFWKACTSSPNEPEQEPNDLPSPKKWPQSDKLASLELEPKIDWAKGMRETWTPGEEGALNRATEFIDRAVDDYATDRDRPDREGVSMMSPHLHFGEISPHKLYQMLREAHDDVPPSRWRKGASVYYKELGWREFAYHLLYHFPHTTDEPLREQFKHFSWEPNENHLRAWQKGRTGYPLVDAGMRQLWRTGWMHNRIRMVVASFLVKDLRVSWLEGAKWFWDTLVDADLANNTLGWQWTAGCGADAAPFFRIFNPVSQGEKFDPSGDYVREWVPELAELPDKWIHHPWDAPAEVLEKANVVLGETYPKPIVDHKEARKKALEEYEAIKGK